uniref:Uncharacterized protein n=1 Tax=uncultured Rhodospirillales bacterium HF0200_01O14 TaxID=710787 RepID=E0XTW3_9PROT|nr:hypothetical protein [uncultured Rhodospirillales bacterium HF0200_01O14]
MAARVEFSATPERTGIRPLVTSTASFRTAIFSSGSRAVFSPTEPSITSPSTPAVIRASICSAVMSKSIEPSSFICVATAGKTPVQFTCMGKQPPDTARPVTGPRTTHLNTHIHEGMFNSCILYTKYTSRMQRDFYTKRKGPANGAFKPYNISGLEITFYALRGPNRTVPTCSTGASQSRRQVFWQ